MSLTDELLSKTGLDGLLDLIYPPVCLTCGESLDSAKRLVCDVCLNKIDEFSVPFCNACKLLLKTGLKCKCKSEYSAPVFALGHYVDPLKEMIHKLKYNQFTRLAEKLSTMLYASQKERMDRIEADAIIPIPLYSLRYKLRGFNQAELIADGLASKLNIPVRSDLLIKTKRTADQIKLSNEERAKNIVGSFEAIPSDNGPVNIILVDDVITTGSTIKEALKALKKQGYKPKAICALAIAGDDEIY